MEMPEGVHKLREIAWSNIDETDKSRSNAKTVLFAVELIIEMAEALEQCIEVSKSECTFEDDMNTTTVNEVLKKFKEWK